LLGMGGDKFVLQVEQLCLESHDFGQGAVALV
jgi:hypothetical protein